MFIVAILQHIKIGDLSQSGMSLSNDEPEEMDVDEIDHLPEGTEIGSQVQLSRAEERSIVRDSTAGFAGAPNIRSSNSNFGRLFLFVRLGGIIIPPRPCSFREFT